MVIGFGAFSLLTANYPVIHAIVSVSLSCGYAIYMYSKLYKVGERDTKSYVKEKPYPCKGFVLSGLLMLVNTLFAVLYHASFFAPTILVKLLCYFPFKIWGYTFSAFLTAADGSVSILFWVLYYLVPLFSCAFGYFSGMHRWEVGYYFFKNMAYRKKED